MSCAGIIFINGALLSVYREQPLVLARAWVVWRFPLVNMSTLYSPIVVLEASLGDKKWPVWTLSSNLFWWFHKDSIHVSIYFRMLLLYYISKLPFTWYLILADYPVFLLSSPLSLLSPLDCHIPVCPCPLHILNYSFYFPYLGRYFCPIYSLLYT